MTAEEMTDTAAFLDTSFVVRYLTADPPAMARQAAGVIDSEQVLILSELALIETAYVLESFYGVPRTELVDTLIALLSRRNIRPLQLPKSLALEALHLCRESKRVSFADAFLWAQARHHGTRDLYTFDRRFPAVGLRLMDAESG